MNKYYYFIPLISCLIFTYSCNQKKIEKLRAENEELKNKIVFLYQETNSLKEEINKLRETDQNYYNNAIDKLTNAISKEDYQNAINIFEQLKIKFPGSVYIDNWTVLFSDHAAILKPGSLS